MLRSEHLSTLVMVMVMVMVLNSAYTGPPSAFRVQHGKKTYECSTSWYTVYQDARTNARILYKKTTHTETAAEALGRREPSAELAHVQPVLKAAKVVESKDGEQRCAPQVEAIVALNATLCHDVCRRRLSCRGEEREAERIRAQAADEHGKANLSGCEYRGSSGVCT